jgi:hypothetical protein
MQFAWGCRRCGFALAGWNGRKKEANPAKMITGAGTLSVSVLRRNDLSGESHSLNLSVVRLVTLGFSKDPGQQQPYWTSPVSFACLKKSGFASTPHVLRSFGRQQFPASTSRLRLPSIGNAPSPFHEQSKLSQQASQEQKEKMKKPEDFSVDDVCVLFVSLELGHLAPKIRENVVDGPLLLSLTEADFVNDLGLSGLQTKRVLRGIELAKQLSANGGGGEELAEARDKIHRLEKENRELKDEVMNLRAALQPEPAPKQPSQQQQQQQYYQQKEQQQQQQKHHSAGAPVVREAAKGTAKGAILGAVAGAVAGTYWFVCGAAPFGRRNVPRSI